MEVSPQVHALALILQRASGKTRDGSPRLSYEQAVLTVMYSMASGQMPFRDFYITDAGVMEGYRGLLKQIGQHGMVRYSFRPLTPDERMFHDVTDDDLAIACVLRVDRYPDAEFVGYGFVRGSERFSYERGPNGEIVRKPKAPRGGSWGRTAQNRALKDAIRHTPIAVNGLEDDATATINVHNMIASEQAGLLAMSKPVPEDQLKNNPLRPQRSYPDLKPPTPLPVPEQPQASDTNAQTTPDSHQEKTPVSSQEMTSRRDTQPQPQPQDDDDDDDDDDGPLTDEDVRDVQVPPTRYYAADDSVFIFRVMTAPRYTKPIGDVPAWIEHLRKRLAEYQIPLDAVSLFVFGKPSESLVEEDVRQLIGFFFQDLDAAKLTINNEAIAITQQVLG